MRHSAKITPAVSAEAPAHVTRQWPALLLLALTVLLPLWGNAPGISLSPDSLKYLNTAGGFAGGRFHQELMPDGTWRPATAYPPLYPLLLAALPGFGISLPAAARLLALVLYPLDALLLYLVLLRAGCRPFPSLAGALLVVLHPDILQLHLIALTEQPFITLLLMLLFCLQNWPRLRFPAATAGMVAALLLLSRYSALAVIVAACVPVFWQARHYHRRGGRALLLFGGLAFTPIFLMFLHNTTAGSATGRSLGWHPISAGQLRAGAGIVSKWLIPEAVPVPLRALLAAILLLAIGLVFAGYLRQLHWRAAMPLSVTTLWLAGCSLLQLLLTICFVDSATGLEYRHLAPVYLFLVLAVMPAIARWLSARRHGILLLLALLAAHGARSGALLADIREHGLGFSGPRWQASELWPVLRSLPPACVIYSNAPDALLYYSGRPARFAPGETSSGLAPALPDTGAVVVWFNAISWRPYFAPLPALITKNALVPQYADQLATVYRHAP